jgi:hypothetical protein
MNACDNIPSMFPPTGRKVARFARATGRVRRRESLEEIPTEIHLFPQNVASPALDAGNSIKGVASMTEQFWVSAEISLAQMERLYAWRPADPTKSLF